MIYILVSTAIPVSRIPVSSDMISHFYIAEFITHMAEVWRQLILHFPLFERLLKTNIFILDNLIIISGKEKTGKNFK